MYTYMMYKQQIDSSLMPSSQTSPTSHSKFAQTFISYGSYHHNLINKIIHIVCIPLIMATMLALTTYIPWHTTIAGHQIGAFHIAVAVSLIYYATIGLGAAAIMAAVIGLGTLAWNWMFADYKPSEMRNAIIIINVVAWGLQFVGHGVFEKRKPALMDNIFQIYSAPLFVVIELFDLIGIRTKQMQEWKVEIDKNVKQFKSKNEKAKAG